MITTFIWKQIKGTRLIAVPNGKKIKNRENPQGISYVRLTEYGKFSEIGKVWGNDDSLVNLNFPKVRSKLIRDY